MESEVSEVVVVPPERIMERAKILVTIEELSSLDKEYRKKKDRFNAINSKVSDLVGIGHDFEGSLERATKYIDWKVSQEDSLSVEKTRIDGAKEKLKKDHPELMPKESKNNDYQFIMRNSLDLSRWVY